MFLSRSFPLALLIAAQGGTSALPPLWISLGQHSASALPFYGALTFPIRPALHVGTEWAYGNGHPWEERSWTLLHGFDAAAFRNPFHGTGISAGISGMARRNTRWGLFFGPSLEAGYLHLFHPRETFIANGDGTFRRSGDWGRPSALLGPGFHLGFRALREGSMRMSLRADYSYRIQYPYNDLIPIFPHNFLRFGIGLTMDQRSGAGKDE